MARPAKRWAHASIPDHMQVMGATQLRSDNLRSRFVDIETNVRHQVEDSIERTVDFRLGDELANTHM
ncbi:hypothetical protein, partial [Acinetobacter baumannii]|uniref:hypothetical protein n=1 Tax=Acinetobacter baumannii TaxID=470 RepID=UPI0014900052